jgi:hypothetical protein
MKYTLSYTHITGPSLTFTFDRLDSLALRIDKILDNEFISANTIITGTIEPEIIIPEFKPEKNSSHWVKKPIDAKY